MIKDFLQSISELRILGIIFLLILVLSFLAVLVYVFKMKKKDVNRYSRLPLDNPPPPEDNRIPANDKDDKNEE
jgi:cbb3-type cytochrome oxidase subunit 3